MCPVCGSRRVTVVFEQPSLLVGGGVIKRSEDQRGPPQASFRHDQLGIRPPTDQVVEPNDRRRVDNVERNCLAPRLSAEGPPLEPGTSRYRTGSDRGSGISRWPPQRHPAPARPQSATSPVTLTRLLGRSFQRLPVNAYRSFKICWLARRYFPSLAQRGFTHYTTPRPTGPVIQARRATETY
jgi:hypothetical protein